MGKGPLIPIALALLVLLQLGAAWGMRKGPFFMDEGYYITHSWLAANGLVQYRDFNDNHAPGIAFLGSALFSLFPASLESARMLVALSQALTTAAIFILARRIFSERAGIFAAAFYALVIPVMGGSWFVIESFFTLFATLSALFLHELIFGKSKAARLPLLAGALSGCALIFKQPGAAFVAFGAACASLARWEKGWRARISGAAMFLAGAAIPVAACCAYFAANNALLDMAYWTLFFNIEVKGMRDAGFFLFTLEETLALFVAAGAFAALAASALRSRSQADLKLRLFLLFWALSCAALAVPRFNVFHIMASIPPIAIFIGGSAAGIGGLFSKGRATARDFLPAAMATAAAMLLFLACASHYSNSLGGDNIAYLSEIGELISSRAPPGSRIMAFPTLPYTYFFSGRLPATKYIGTDPWVASKETDEDMEAQMRSSSPVVVAYCNCTGPGYPPPWEFLPASDAYIRENYVEYARFRLPSAQKVNATLILMERKE